MPKITTRQDAAATTFVLEGKLVRPWVQELEHCWRAALASRPVQTVWVDLTAVTFIDAPGQGPLNAHGQARSGTGSGRMYDESHCGGHYARAAAACCLQHDPKNHELRRVRYVDRSPGTPSPLHLFPSLEYHLDSTPQLWMRILWT
jgi:hypothetical protein